VNGFENNPVYMIMPPIPDEAKPYLMACTVVFIVLLYLSARAARMHVSLPWLVRYWIERLKAR
jgi:hypothetical protein